MHQPKTIFCFLGALVALSVGFAQIPQKPLPPRDGTDTFKGDRSALLRKQFDADAALSLQDKLKFEILNQTQMDPSQMVSLSLLLGNLKLDEQTLAAYQNLLTPITQNKPLTASETFLIQKAQPLFSFIFTHLDRKLRNNVRTLLEPFAFQNEISRQHFQNILRMPYDTLTPIYSLLNTAVIRQKIYEKLKQNIGNHYPTPKQFPGKTFRAADQVIEALFNGEEVPTDAFERMDQEYQFVLEQTRFIEKAMKVRLFIEEAVVRLIPGMNLKLDGPQTHALLGELATVSTLCTLGLSHIAKTVLMTTQTLQKTRMSLGLLDAGLSLYFTDLTLKSAVQLLKEGHTTQGGAFVLLSVFTALGAKSGLKNALQPQNFKMPATVPVKQKPRAPAVIYAKEKLPSKTIKVDPSENPGPSAPSKVIQIKKLSENKPKNFKAWRFITAVNGDKSTDLSHVVVPDDLFEGIKCGYGELNCSAQAQAADLWLNGGAANALARDMMGEPVSPEGASVLVSFDDLASAQTFYGTPATFVESKNSLETLSKNLTQTLSSLPDMGTALIIQEAAHTQHFFNVRKEGERWVFYDFQKSLVYHDPNIAADYFVNKHSSSGVYVLETTPHHLKQKTMESSKAYWESIGIPNSIDRAKELPTYRDWTKKNQVKISNQTYTAQSILEFPELKHSTPEFKKLLKFIDETHPKKYFYGASKNKLALQILEGVLVLDSGHGVILKIEFPRVNLTQEIRTGFRRLLSQYKALEVLQKNGFSVELTSYPKKIKLQNGQEGHFILQKKITSGLSSENLDQAIAKHKQKKKLLDVFEWHMSQVETILKQSGFEPDLHSSNSFFTGSLDDLSDIIDYSFAVPKNMVFSEFFRKNLLIPADPKNPILTYLNKHITHFDPVSVSHKTL